MSDTEAPIDDAVERVLAAARSEWDGNVSDELIAALNALAVHPRPYEVRLEVASHLVDLDSPAGAGLLAVWLGGGVEQGIEPEATTLPILRTMWKWAKTVDTPAEDEEAEISEPEEGTLIGLERLGQALVAHLSRSPLQLAEIAANEEIVTELERVEHVSPGPMWVLELLRKRSGSLVVIHVESRKGFHVAYENISNCFHLFTLLQGELSGKVPDARTPSSEIMAIALGQKFGDSGGDTAWWHYGVGTIPEASLGGSVWGEASPDSIPVIEGQQVLLLWPMMLESRGWGVGFFGPLLMAKPPKVSITKKLSPKETDDWWAKLHLPLVEQKATEEKKPFWKFW